MNVLLTLLICLLSATIIAICIDMFVQSWSHEA